MEMEMEANWARIKAHLEKQIEADLQKQIEADLQNQSEADLQKQPALNVDATRPFFNPPATEEEILGAEAALGLARFPADFRAFLKLHNGQARQERVLGLGVLLSTAEIVEQWGCWDELLEDGDLKPNRGDGGDGVKRDWWNKRWVPITHDGSSYYDCLDMDPAEGGVVGQVIEMHHDDGARPLQARSFSAWLALAAEDMEAGRLVWEEDEGFYRKGYSL